MNISTSFSLFRHQNVVCPPRTSLGDLSPKRPRLYPVRAINGILNSHTGREQTVRTAKGVTRVLAPYPGLALYTGADRGDDQTEVSPSTRWKKYSASYQEDTLFSSYEHLPHEQEVWCRHYLVMSRSSCDAITNLHSHHHTAIKTNAKEQSVVSVTAKPKPTNSQDHVTERNILHITHVRLNNTRHNLRSTSQ